MKKKCNWCEKETSRPHKEFAEIGWRAVQFDNKKGVCACPMHGKEHKDYMDNELRKRGRFS